MSAKDNTVTRKVFSNAYNIQAPMDDSNYISRVFRVLLVSRSGRSTIDCTTLRNKEVTYNEDHAGDLRCQFDLSPTCRCPEKKKQGSTIMS